MGLDPVEAPSQIILEGPTPRAVQALDRDKVRMAVLQSRAQPREHTVYGRLLTPLDFFENHHGFTVLLLRNFTVSCASNLHFGVSYSWLAVLLSPRDRDNKARPRASFSCVLNLERPRSKHRQQPRWPWLSSRVLVESSYHAYSFSFSSLGRHSSFTPHVIFPAVILLAMTFHARTIRNIQYVAGQATHA